MNELISIIVPVYNAKFFLQKCLESLINQTYNNIEIICIDDSSTDNSLELLQHYSKKDSRIKVFSKSNEGVSIARNYGLDLSNGSYIMFVDADDWIDENTCKLAYEAITSNGADIVMWPYIREQQGIAIHKVIFTQSIVFESYQERKAMHRRFAGPYGDEICKPENMDSLCPVWGKLYKKEIIRDIRFEDIRQIGSFEDGLFNLYVFGRANRIFFLNEFLYHYRANNQSITNKYNPNLFEQRKEVYKKIKDYANSINDKSFLEALSNRISIDSLGLGINVMTKPDTVRGKLDDIKSIVTDAERDSALNSFNVKKMPLHWRMYYEAAKKKRALEMYLMLCAIQKLRRR